MAANILSTKGAHTFRYTTVTGNLPIVAGSLQIIGNTPMIPLESATVAGVVINCQVGGTVLLPKRAAGAATGGAWTAGSRVYYVAATGATPAKASGLAGAGILIGYGVETTTTGATSAKVHLLSGPIPLETQA